ncbi:uncharacterized protein LOC133959076 isoform X2 [Platichthys flesus]|uniref:uncharacterized protein LOC133959076 isoform X2 n=1 Tax=Platichthys flesus TaxID=8260 RepID=UPI002DBB8544|nr:uncharacterized protein LOC133959076 isoform X2 [Platichthys flesus]
MLVFMLLLLGGAASVDTDSFEKLYGETVTFRMRTYTLSIKFIPRPTYESVIIWKPGDPSVPVDSRRSVSGGYLEIKNLTQKDNGRYVMIGRNERVLLSYSLEVIAQYKDFNLKAGEELSFTYPLVKDHCNIHFFPKKWEYYERMTYDIQLVRSGRTVDTNFFCNDFEFVKPCGLEMEIQEPCYGYFEVRDQYDGVALNVTVDWMGEPFDLGYIGICVGSSLVSLICCCCVKRCCCKSSKKKDPDSAAAEVAVAYNEYDHEPVALGPAQPSPRPVTYYTAPPPQALTGPLIHNPTIVNGPHAYSEVSAPAEPAYAPVPSLLSDSGLQFELKGMNFPCAPPLSADPTYISVYTSNKLDFL